LLLLGRGVEKGVVCGDALAAVAVTGAAFAQNVTIGGNLNISAVNNSKVTTQTGVAASTSIKSSGTAVDNGWTASQILISGSEDLGGGLTASFAFATGLGNGTSTFADRDRNLALSGGFGTVRFGRFVPAAAMGYHGFSGSASTSVGSIYALGAGNAVSNDTTGASAAAGTTDRFGAVVAGSYERNNNNLQYTSPNFNGFVVNVNYGSSSTDRSNANRQGEAKTTQDGISVTYVSGPLSLGLGSNNRKVERENNPGSPNGASCIAGGVVTNVAPGVACANTTDTRVGGAAAVGQRTQKGDMDWIGASYDLGVARVFATHVKRKDTTSTPTTAAVTNADIKVNSIGVSVPMGAITLGASFYRGKDKVGALATDDTKLSGHQLAATYALSKRTVVYALAGQNQVKRDGGNTAGLTRKETGTMVGVMHSF